MAAKEKTSSVSQSDIPLSRRLKPIWEFVLRFQSYFGLIVIVIVAAFLSPVRDGQNIFLDPRNILNIVRFASENGIIAIGMTFVILTGGIDLSVGAVLALCAVGAAAFMMRLGFGTVETVLAVLALGGLVGFINGFVTTKFKIQSFITTLAMLSIARGVATLWADGYAIPLAYGDGTNLAPPSFKFLFAGSISLFGLAVPVQALYFVSFGIIAALLLKRTGFGRHVYAVGGNEIAARLSGINVDRVRIIVFAISGLLTAFAAMLHAALVNQGSPVDGIGFELNAIAAVVIGGTSLMGGVGTIIGTMIGAVILGILDNILGLLNIASEFQAILKGVIIVLAVIIQRQRR
jgi:ribose transport system permease protein